MATPSQSSSLASSSAPTSEACQEHPQASGYCLVWQDEFQGSAVDLTRWSLEKNCYGGGNNELQCYVDSPDNVWVDGEFLHIRALAEAATGPSLPDDDPNYDAADQSGRGEFTSARLRSLGKGDWRYGRFEVRAKLPSGQGSWPAVWMLPTDWVYGGWAASGEIDIVEAVNLKVGGEDRVHGTLHFGAPWPDNVYAGVPHQLPDGANPADDFHVYAVEWEEGEIRWYVDEDHYATQTDNGWYSTAALEEPSAPFNQQFHLIMNLAVGGDWAAQVNDTGVDVSAFPQELVVDYVRVYECQQDTVTGRGCASRDADYTLQPGVLPPAPDPNVPATQMVLFADTVLTPFYWQSWAASGDVTVATAAVDAAQGVVATLSFDSVEGVAYLQTETPVDLSAYSAIEFELKILSETQGEVAQVYFRADCTYPCSSGPIPLNSPAAGSWQNYRISTSSLAAGGLNLTQVNTPFVLGTAQSDQQGLVLQVDNVRLVP